MQKVARNQGKKSKKIEKKSDPQNHQPRSRTKKFVFLNVNYPLH